MEFSQPDEEYPLTQFKGKAIVVTKESCIEPELLIHSKYYLKYISQVVVTGGSIVNRVDHLAKQIFLDYKGRKVYLLVVLKGAITFGNILQEKLHRIVDNNFEDTQTSFMFEYVTISSYFNDSSTGKINIKSDKSIFESLEGKDVIVIEDTYDSGSSMSQLMTFLEQFNLNSLKVAVLFWKQNIKNLKYSENFLANYIGFVIPDFFVIGAGLDYNEMFRDLKHLCTISEEGKEEFKIKK